MAKAIFDGVVIAESDDVRRVEGISYFPLSSVDQSKLLETPTTTRCIWKGKASYYSVEGNSETAVDAAFQYKKPWPLAKKLVSDRIGFWRDVQVV